MTTLTSVTARRARPQLSVNLSFWVLIAAYLGLMFAASAPSALYTVYQADWHFSAITLTSIFAVYALALIITLLTVGGLSDFIGRRPVLIASFLLLVASMVVFANADSVAWLYAGRILQGLAAGSAIGALSAGIIDFAGPRRMRFAALANSLVPSLGLSLGALGAGGLVQFAPAPTELVYALLAGLFVLVVLAVAFGPEAEQRRTGAVASLTPRMRVPRRIRPQFLKVVPALFAPWAQIGFTLSLTTSLAAVTFGLHDHFTDSAVVALICAAAFVANVLIRDLSPRTSTLIGCAGMIGGGALTLVSLIGPWTALFFAGSIVSGFGLGATLGAAMRTLSGLPAHEERGEFFASVYVVGYLAFSLPAVVAGVCVVHVGLTETTVGYGIGLIVLSLLAAANVVRPTRTVGTSDLSVLVPQAV